MFVAIALVMDIVRRLPTTYMTLVTVTENHILELALYKAMILHTFLGTEKMTQKKHSKYSVHFVQSGIN